MANLKEVRRKISKWVETNIGTGQDYVHAPFAKQPVSQTSLDSTESAAPKNPLDVLEGLASGEIEVPDLPTPPGPNETMTDFGKGLASDTAQSFVIGVFTSVLKHLIDSPAAPPKKK